MKDPVLMNVFLVSDWAAGAETGAYEEPAERIEWVLFVGDEAFDTMHGDGVIIFWLYPHHRYGEVVRIGQIRQNLYTTEYSRCYFNVVTNENSARNFSWRERSPPGYRHIFCGGLVIEDAGKVSGHAD